MRTLVFVVALTAAMPAHAQFSRYCSDCSDYQQQMLDLQSRQVEALEEQNKRLKQQDSDREWRRHFNDDGFLPGGPPFPGR